MKVTFYGTRGSIPVWRPDVAQHGGNTTCVRVDSSCLPEGHWLVIDAGSGIVPLSIDFYKAGGKSVDILQSHYHHDHTQGLPMAGFLHDKRVPLGIFGPVQLGYGPREVYQTLIQPPFFPVPFRQVASHLQFHKIEYPQCMVIIYHPRAGLKVLDIETYERVTANGRQLPMKSEKVHPDECLVIFMYTSNHPEQTISYRFEERPTGQVFTFVTDHENTDGLDVQLRGLANGADLLVMDCQYPREAYDAKHVGWGHATPDYVTMVARQCQVKALGLTHHNPPASDEEIAAQVRTAQRHMAEAGSDIPVLPCSDYLTLDIGFLSLSIAVA
jgi:ribonuclease BN (tRNA processing enzyme)